MSRKKPVVGQTLYALNVGNNARHREQELKPVIVVSVGRKYFKAIPEEYKNAAHMAIEYELEDWRERTDYTPGWRLYESAQAWSDERETYELDTAIGKRFAPHHSGVDLPRLRRIRDILLEITP